MQDRVNELMDRIAGQAKAKAGEMLEHSRLEREGRAQANKVEAPQQAQELEQLARDKRQEAAGHEGQQMAQQDK